MRVKTKSVARNMPPVFFRRAALALAISAVFASVATVAGEKLDMSFIQGGAGVNPEVWAALNGNYAPGRYLVDLSLNGKESGKQILDVTPQDSNELCLTEAWLTKAGIYVSADYFREGYNEGYLAAERFRHRLECNARRSTGVSYGRGPSG